MSTGPNSAREAINTVTLANAVSVVAHAVSSINSSAISSSLNGETLTHATIAAMAAQQLKETLVAKASS